MLRLNAVDYWRRRLHEVVKSEPLHRRRRAAARVRAGSLRC